MLANFIITERGPDGVERIVYGPELKQLDVCGGYGSREFGRVIVAEAVAKGLLTSYDPEKHEVSYMPYQRFGRSE